MGPSFDMGVSDQRMGKADCSANLDCIENAQCYSNLSALSLMRKATAYLIYEDDDDGLSYGCTGGTLNDNNTAHRKAWLLTANHCISSEGEANSLEARFGYKSDCGSCNSSITDSILGADLHATSTNADFTLLELSDLPSSWGLLGWTNQEVREDDGLELYRISHPKHQPQAYSKHEVDSDLWSNQKWIYSETLIGTTEGGSSGSPICKSGGIVVGQLYGKAYSGSYDSCVPANNWRFRDGAFSYYWKSVRPYLASASSTSYKMHVSNISAGIETINFGFIKFYRFRASISVQDELGNGIPNVTVFGEFDNGFNGGIGRTNSKGNAVVTSPGLMTAVPPSFDFCVIQLTHDYFNTYDSSANVVTCDSN